MKNLKNLLFIFIFLSNIAFSLDLNNFKDRQSILQDVKNIILYEESISRAYEEYILTKYDLPTITEVKTILGDLKLQNVDISPSFSLNNNHLTKISYNLSDDINDTQIKALYESDTFRKRTYYRNGEINFILEDVFAKHLYDLIKQKGSGLGVCAGVANAQSTATVSGTIAAGYLKAIDGSKGLVLDSNSIRVGLTEDLGDGLKLSAYTQFKGNSARGGNLTKEDSAMTLSSSWGSLAYQNTRTSTLARDVGLVGDNWLWDNPYSSNNKEVFSREAADYLTYTTADMSGIRASVAYFETATTSQA